MRIIHNNNGIINIRPNILLNYGSSFHHLQKTMVYDKSLRGNLLIYKYPPDYKEKQRLAFEKLRNMFPEDLRGKKIEKIKSKIEGVEYIEKPIDEGVLRNYIVKKRLDRITKNKIK